MSELKPCPFCGSEEINIETIGNFSWGECCACGATSRDFRLDASFNPLQRVDGAEVYWNTRLLEDALLARAEKAEADLSVLREQTRWIPVSERLPDAGENNYLTLSPLGEVFIMCFNEFWYSPFDENGDESTINVTHWMPLPPPPEEE